MSYLKQEISGNPFLEISHLQESAIAFQLEQLRELRQPFAARTTFAFLLTPSGCIFRGKLAAHSGPNQPPVPAQCRPPIPIESGPPIPVQIEPYVPVQTRPLISFKTRHMGGLMQWSFSGQSLSPLRLRSFRMDSPFSSSRWEPLTRRSRIASATVGLPPLR